MRHKKGKKPSKKTFPVWGWIALIVGLLVITGIIVVSRIQPPVASLPAEITVNQAVQLRDQGAYILDVREPDEWAQFHIQGATLIPLEELLNRLSEVPKDRKVIVVCRTGHRSAQGRDILKAAGYSQVTSMIGGLTQWQAQGLPLTTGF